MAEAVESLSSIKDLNVQAAAAQAPVDRRRSTSWAAPTAPAAARPPPPASGSSAAPARSRSTARTRSEYFARPVLRLMIKQPLEAAKRETEFDVDLHGRRFGPLGPGRRCPSRHRPRARRTSSRNCASRCARTSSSRATRAPSSARSTARRRPAAPSSSRSARPRRISRFRGALRETGAPFFFRPFSRIGVEPWTAKVFIDGEAGTTGPADPRSGWQARRDLQVISIDPERAQGPGCARGDAERGRRGDPLPAGRCGEGGGGAGRPTTAP